MRITSSVVIAVLFLTGLAACGDDEPAATTLSCGDIGFTQRTDDGAFNIVATGVSCERARAVAATTRNRRVSDPLSYEAGGFSCAGTRVPGDGLPGVDWNCSRNGDTITFTRN